MTTLDPLDARILLALDDEPDAPAVVLARTLGISRNTVHARLQRLAREGALEPFSRRVPPAALGFELVAFVSLQLDQAAGDAALDGLATIPEIVEMHATTGDGDVLVRVVARDTQDLYRLANAMLAIDGVVRAATSVSLAQVMPYRTRQLLERATAQPGALPAALPADLAADQGPDVPVT